MMTQHQEDYLTFEEAAALLGVSRRTIERYIEQGQLQRYRQGSRVYVRRDNVIALSRVQPDSRQDTDH